MNKINDYFDKEKIQIQKISYIKGKQILETTNGMYEIIDKRNNVKEVYDYLISKNFKNFLDIENSYDDPYEVYRYIEDNTNPKDKAINLVYLLASLHNKTTTYQETNENELKKIYESINNKLSDIDSYYYNLQDSIETKIYMAPAEYLLIRNMSKIYASINNSRYYINKWYENKKDKKSERNVLVHNNISLDNFIDKEDKRFKDWTKSKKDYAVYDFYNFYRNNYNDLEFSSLFNIYQEKYKYTEEELLLFKALLFIPWKVELKNNNYNNCIVVNNLLNYIDKTNSFYLEHNQENQKTNNEELNK